ncbi:phytanoyl-CoA dioxygenase family protein [Caballeronia sp. dw_19]|uniref:phytanoyl-CoA dioxygenase family protein n=1 Tax=Caballeronia sp. dw_19 TaxID=2719791 RepID=UPI001BD28619|nr:phytanoyl-CoA dioxygenase family protein [Caballeronia sp. dw_19]
MSDSSFAREHSAALDADGYVVVRRMVDAEQCAHLCALADHELAACIPPLEFEADVGYPGAPHSQGAPGGQTVRRLLAAYARHPAFSAWATSTACKALLETYFCGPARLSLAHHNSLMSKYPLYGSATGWHRDIRYWSFERDNLISVRLALGSELAANGAIRFIPGSHRMRLDHGRFDEALFFREDHPENQKLIDMGIEVELNAGDAVFFHCNTLHRAGRNLSEHVKLSLNFAYHSADNYPIQGTRSASSASVAI